MRRTTMFVLLLLFYLINASENVSQEDLVWRYADKIPTYYKAVSIKCDIKSGDAPINNWMFSDDMTLLQSKDKIRLYDNATGHCFYSKENPSRFSALFPPQKLVLVDSKAAVMTIIDISNSQEKTFELCEGPEKIMPEVKFNTLTTMKGNILKVYDVDTGERKTTVIVPPSCDKALIRQKSATEFFIPSQGIINLFDGSSIKMSYLGHEDKITSLYSDKKKLYATSDSALVIWYIANGEELKHVNTPTIHHLQIMMVTNAVISLSGRFRGTNGEIRFGVTTDTWECKGIPVPHVFTGDFYTIRREACLCVEEETIGLLDNDNFRFMPIIERKRRPQWIQPCLLVDKTIPTFGVIDNDNTFKIYKPLSHEQLKYLVNVYENLKKINDKNNYVAFIEQNREKSEIYRQLPKKIARAVDAMILDNVKRM